MSVDFSISVRIETLEENDQAVHSREATLSKNLSDLVNDLVRCFTGNAENWVHVGVVATAFVCNPACEFLEIDLSVAILIELVKQSSELIVSEDAPDCLKGLFELFGANSAVPFQVKVLEDALGSLSFIVGTVCALADLFENDRFNLSDSGSGDD